VKQSGVCVVTGGAGFIGCALSESLAMRFERVVVVDILHPQIHPTQQRPNALAAAVELRIQDIREASTWDTLLSEVTPTTIVHLAAETGTGQSLTEGTRHATVNVVGTTQMLDALARFKVTPSQILLTSSRAVYGEGPWENTDGTIAYPGQRTATQLAASHWDFSQRSARPANAAQTVPSPVSVYGATKLAQEHILKAWATAYSVCLKILRLQNVYGPGQSLSNPYTGIVSLFCRLARDGKSIPLYEDGLMLRDFILIDDVASAILHTLDAPNNNDVIFDVGTGRALTIADLAKIIAKHYGAPEPHVCAKYRYGDVRHASCDPAAIFQATDWRPKFSVEQGIVELTRWIEAQLAPVTSDNS